MIHTFFSYFIRFFWYITPLTWIFLALEAISPLNGTSKTITARPAKALGPNSNHRKTIDRTICRGQDQIRWMKFVTSLKRWASADIRFTVSPTVDPLRLSLDITKAWWERSKMEQENLSWRHNAVFNFQKCCTITACTLSSWCSFFSLYLVVHSSHDGSADLHA